MTGRAIMSLFTAFFFIDTKARCSPVQRFIINKCYLMKNRFLHATIKTPDNSRKDTNMKIARFIGSPCITVLKVLKENFKLLNLFGIFIT
ncbi:hypothetical protein C0J52_04377 [Blattella germanica]|nr:hypothetical protein C0J52_04377 [Blattella germanica]